MGEVAEIMIEGLLCSGCGAWMDSVLNGEDAPGHPVYCDDCE